jgi:hypothetical protein
MGDVLLPLSFAPHRGAFRARRFMAHKKSDADENPEQTVITKEEWDARELAACLLSDDEDTVPLPTETNRPPGKITVLNPFNIPDPGPVIDAGDPPADETPTVELKPCPLCSGVAILFPTNPSVACVVYGCEVWGETIHEAVTRWNTRPADRSEPSE